MIALLIIAEAVGGLCFGLGWGAWKNDKINLFHDYHVKNVREEDRHAFCRMSGIGLIALGLGIAAAGIVFCFAESPVGLIPLFVGIAAGLTLLIVAEKKYNRK